MGYTAKAVERTGKEIRLPLSEAFQISLEHIVKRQTRSTIIVASTALGIAYLTYFLATNAIYGASLGRQGAPVEAYHMWLVIVSVLVCAVGLINSTLIAVLERYREVGTMKCLGALDRHILALFLVEAVLLGFVGGAAGFVLGTMVSIISSGSQLGFSVLLALPLLELLKLSGIVVGLSVVLSISATLYPAFRAANLNPVEALRYDV